jgi:hypothetical protein
MTEFLAQGLSLNDILDWLRQHNLDLDQVAFVQLTPKGLHAVAGPQMDVFSYALDSQSNRFVVDETNTPAMVHSTRRILGLPAAPAADDGARCNPEIYTDNTDTVVVQCDTHHWVRSLDDGDVITHFSQLREIVEAHWADPHADVQVADPDPEAAMGEGG